VKLMSKNQQQKIRISTVLVGFALLSLSGVSFATAQTLGGVASNVIASFAAIGKLITAGSYIAGLAFAVGAIMKFKQHKDNPTQIQIGQPIGLVVIAAALLFMPTVLETLGATMFGSAKTAGPGGTTIGSTGGS
jgi:intracellular multiplication protein IcmD